jgi:hypothetical protein
MGIGGIKVLISMAPSTSPTSSLAAGNIMEGGKQVQPDVVDFVPHDPACVHAYAHMKNSMEMMFGSFRFLVRKEGFHRLSVLIFSAPFAAKSNFLGSPTTSVESGGEVSQPRCIKPAHGGVLEDLFGDMTFGSFTGSDRDSDPESCSNFNSISDNNSTYSREVFADRYDGATDPESDESFMIETHQICIITGANCEANEESKSFDELSNRTSTPKISRGEREQNTSGPNHVKK